MASESTGGYSLGLKGLEDRENNSIKVANRASEAQSPVGDNNGPAFIGSSETPSIAQWEPLTVYLKTQRQNRLVKASLRACFLTLWGKEGRIPWFFPSLENVQPRIFQSPNDRNSLTTKTAQRPLPNDQSTETSSE